MSRSQPHPGARKLRYYLYRQLQFLRKGLIEEALFLLDPIEKIISEISHEKINDRISLEILEHCSRLNEEIVLRFETEKFALKKGMFQAEVERKIREFLS